MRQRSLFLVKKEFQSDYYASHFRFERSGWKNGDSGSLANIRLRENYLQRVGIGAHITFSCDRQ